jgi:hypothetical protein
MRARHLHHARAEGFFLDRLFPRRFFPLLAAVLISVLAVFPVGHESLLSGYCLASSPLVQVRREFNTGEDARACISPAGCAAPASAPEL